MSHTRIYRIWSCMIHRTTNKNATAYPQYGGAGISACEEWRDFRNFYRDMKEGYCDTLTIDRIDGSKGYYKENCRWATMSEQRKNQSRNKKYTIDGVTKILTDWCIEYGVSRPSVISRVQKGWDIERALTQPVKKQVSCSGTCISLECDRKARVKAMCDKHYRRVLKSQDK